MMDPNFTNGWQPEIYCFGLFSELDCSILEGAVLGFELRAFALVRQVLYHLSYICSPFFLLLFQVVFQIGSHILPQGSLDYDLLLMTSHVARAIGVCHHDQIICSDEVPLTFCLHWPIIVTDLQAHYGNKPSIS
jgi:hypothetical protein